MSGTVVSAEDIRSAVDWLGRCGDLIEFNEGTWTKNDDGAYDGGVWLVGRIKSTGEYIEARYVLAEATVGPPPDLFDFNDDDGEVE